MDCHKAREVLFLFADNEMGEELLVAFRRHLGRCPECERRIDYTQKLLALLRRSCRRQTAPSRLRIRILSSLPHRSGEA